MADGWTSRSLKSAEIPAVRSLKSDELSALPSPLYSRSPPAIRSLTPDAMSSYSPFTLDIDEYRPSIADQVRVGYFSQDRAAQTDSTEILKLKEMTQVLQQLVRDVDNQKRSLHYAKHVLQADYENKLQERALDLYCRVNDTILDLEKMHEERIQVVRRSYRQQLADAISEISNQQKVYYNKKRKQENARHAEKLQKAQEKEDEKKQTQQQQESLLEMMRMQMREAQERADVDLKEALERPQTPSSVATDPEIYDLRDEVANLESKLDDAMTELEDKENENRRLATDLEDLNEQIEQERKRITQLKKELSDAVLNGEQERNRLKAEMVRQRLALQNEMEARIQETKSSAMAASQKQVEELKRLHNKNIQNQEMSEKKRLVESLAAKTSVTCQTYKPTRSLLDKEQLSESEKDDLVNKLQKLEKKQRAEIFRLQRELERANKMWELKVTILQQTMHALKDESFLRTSLQRQAARLQHAAVVYASNGPAVMPLHSPHRPSKTFRTLPAIRPGRVEGFGRILEGKGMTVELALETPFTEDRPSPVPEQLDPEEERLSENATSESISDVNRDAPRKEDQYGRPSTAPGSRASSHVVVLPQVLPVEA